MALRNLVTRMGTPVAAAALRPPSVSRGAQAASSRPFSRQVEHEDISKIRAKKKYEFSLFLLEQSEKQLESLKVWAQRFQRADKYLGWTLKVVMPASLAAVIAGSK